MLMYCMATFTNSLKTFQCEHDFKVECKCNSSPITRFRFDVKHSKDIIHGNGKANHYYEIFECSKTFFQVEISWLQLQTEVFDCFPLCLSNLYSQHT